LFPLFATDVIDTGGKFAADGVYTGGKFTAGVVDTGGNMPPVSLQRWACKCLLNPQISICKSKHFKSANFF
jgi:hypothetical protein